MSDADFYTSDLLHRLNRDKERIFLAETSWRKLPFRRLRVEWQSLSLAVGEWMLRTFPFLRPPAEWAVERLDRLARWWSR